MPIITPINARPPSGAAIAITIVVVLGPPLALGMGCSVSFCRVAVGDDVASVLLGMVAVFRFDGRNVVGIKVPVSELLVWGFEPVLEDNDSVNVVAGGDVVVPVDKIVDEIVSRREVVVTEVDSGTDGVAVTPAVANWEELVWGGGVGEVLPWSFPSRPDTPSPSAPRSPPSVCPDIMVARHSTGAYNQRC